jgi:diguanylate cyclase (GGDEF)-like protein/PAS domain S-box-containing protein
MTVAANSYNPWHTSLNHLLEAVCLVDEGSLQITYANDAALKLLGKPREALLGKPVLEISPTPQDQCYWGEPTHILHEGIHSLSSVQHADGRLIPVDRRVSRIQLGQGGYVFMVAMLDRSEQDNSESELEILLGELRATLDSAADGILVCGLDDHVRAFNQRLVQIWSIPSDMLLKRDDAAIMAHMAAQVADPSAYQEQLKALAQDPMQDHIDTVHLSSGVVLEMRVVAQVSRGRAVGRVFSFRDITRQAEVQASLRLAARVFESSLDAIFIADAQHRLLRMNPGCMRLAGPSAAAFEGAPAAALFGRAADADFMEQVRTGWAQDGFWEGELWLPRENGAYCAVQLSWVALRDDEGRLVQSVGFMRDLTLQHAAQKRIEELAYSDVLTGLPNRLLLAQRVETAIQGARNADSGFAILFLDLDRFKIVNDSLGHPFGDRVLQLVAERLQASLRQTDMLCRLGGDEFVIYLHGGDAVVAENVAHRILEDMLRPFALDNMGFSIQCSIGIALYPLDGTNLDDLIKQADTAMYRVKERGRGSYGFYQPQMNANLLSRMKLEHAMRQALGDNRMAVHYQPQVNMATGRINAAEALVRWKDPEFGSVSPGTFIPLAEESGYIVTLGAWVMEQAISEAAAWMRAGSAITISVNVSALEFRQPDFVDRITRLLAVHQLPPTLLELELTETILLQDAQEMEQRLAVLADLGISLAIDDFGTGYSSLGYLKKLPIHKLKIDQSFVRGLPEDEEDLAIVSAIISMGRAMRIEVIAEGVETRAQQAVLSSMQCAYYQGYLCAPGLPGPEFRQMLERQAAGELQSVPAPSSQ